MTNTTWIAPKTWTTGELLTATLMNTELGNQLQALKNPASANYILNQASNYTTTSTTFVDIDSTNLSLTMVTGGGDVIIGFSGNAASTGWVNFDVALDSVRIGGDDGLITAGGYYPFSFIRLYTGLSAASHNFKLQWKVATSGSGTLYAGAGTTSFDIHPQFWVREVS